MSWDANAEDIYDTLTEHWRMSTSFFLFPGKVRKFCCKFMLITFHVHRYMDVIFLSLSLLLFNLNANDVHMRDQVFDRTHK